MTFYQNIAKGVPTNAFIAIQVAFIDLAKFNRGSKKLIVKKDLMFHYTKAFSKKALITSDNLRSW